MKFREFLEVEKYAIDLGLFNIYDGEKMISVSKVRKFVNNNQEIIKMFNKYLIELEAFPIKIGDAVKLSDGSVGIVKFLVRTDNKNQYLEYLVTEAVVVNVNNEHKKCKLTDLKKLEDKL